MANESSKEARILRVMKQVLTSIAKDTATAPGMRHPLSERTLEDMRLCLLLISERESELAEEAGGLPLARPHFKDEPKAPKEVVVPFSKIGRKPEV